MSFTPHTEAEIANMLTSVGVKSIDDLFDEIPDHLRAQPMQGIPQAVNEATLLREVQARGKHDTHGLCFLGAGSYEHHIPAAVWDIASRGEYMTAYTPYQAEASQGSLQLIYEFQTMMAKLTGMAASNASLYDGATALAEAVLMAARGQRKNKSQRILVLGSLHPHYLATLQTMISNQGFEIVLIPFCSETGMALLPDDYVEDDFNSLVIQQPNFFGCLEVVDELTDWAHARGAAVIACVNPISLAVLKEPGAWGQLGADIVCGEGQPLGVPMSSGGPYFGFLCCQKPYLRQMPGRIVGRTLDQVGRPGFTLTLQAREQHIRRAKATSNICTNQGLLVTAATIYMSLVGEQGLRHVAAACHAKTGELLQALTTIKGVEAVFSASFFHECVIRLPKNADKVLAQLADRGLQGGLALAPYYPQLADCILICATEIKTTEEITEYQQQLQQVLMQ